MQQIFIEEEFKEEVFPKIKSFPTKSRSLPFMSDTNHPSFKFGLE